MLLCLAFAASILDVFLNLSLTSLGLDSVGVTFLGFAALSSHLLRLCFKISLALRFSSSFTFSTIPRFGFTSFALTDLVLLAATLVSDPFCFNLGQTFGFDVSTSFFLLTS
jgi:hypothetical protein